jgi:hypothetical protein
VKLLNAVENMQAKIQAGAIGLGLEQSFSFANVFAEYTFGVLRNICNENTKLSRKFLRNLRHKKPKLINTFPSNLPA